MTFLVYMYANTRICVLSCSGTSRGPGSNPKSVFDKVLYNYCSNFLCGAFGPKKWGSKKWISRFIFKNTPNI